MLSSVDHNREKIYYYWNKGNVETIGAHTREQQWQRVLESPTLFEAITEFHINSFHWSDGGVLAQLWVGLWSEGTYSRFPTLGREANRELINQSYSYKSNCLPSHSKWRCNRPQGRSQDPTYLSPLTYLTVQWLTYTIQKWTWFSSIVDCVQNCHFYRMNSSRTDLLWMTKWSVQYWTVSDWDHIVSTLD